jgi:phage shock protein A
LQQGEAQVTEQLAQEKLIQADLQRAQENADAWNKKAELAVTKNADDLAREALRRAGDYQAQVTIYQKQLDAQHHAVEELRSNLGQLPSKYESAVRNKDLLIARAKRAEAVQVVAKAAARLSDVDYTSDLAHMERRIEEKEARAAAADELQQTSVDARFEALGADDDVEERLAALKQKLGQS